MKSIEDKGCLNYGPAQEGSGTNNTINLEFHKGNRSNRASHHRTALGKPTPSKWDDAQKWLVNLSRGGERHESTATKPRDSNADDRRLITAVPVKEEYYYGEEEGHVVENGFPCQYEVETKNVDSEESIWRINKPSQVQNRSTAAVRSICVRDMGTEMTPIGSQDPSRAGTPIRAISPAGRSPISSGPSTPVRAQQTNSGSNRDFEEPDPGRGAEDKNLEQAENVSHLETRAVAWDEAERAKYMARYKREEVKIQAWENHQKRKAEMEMKRMEVKAERLKARALEKMTNKLAATRRIAEEKLANAEAELNEKAVRTSERADYIRRTGHLPSSFSFKLPSFCW